MKNECKQFVVNKLEMFVYYLNFYHIDIGNESKSKKTRSFITRCKTILCLLKTNHNNIIHKMAVSMNMNSIILHTLLYKHF